MRNYKITIRRHVTKIDEFTRVIRASSDQEARQKAEALAEASDHNCPDNCAETSDIDLGDFYVEDVEQTGEEADDDEEMDDAD